MPFKWVDYFISEHICVCVAVQTIRSKDGSHPRCQTLGWISSYVISTSQYYSFVFSQHFGYHQHLVGLHKLLRLVCKTDDELLPFIKRGINQRIVNVPQYKLPIIPLNVFYYWPSAIGAIFVWPIIIFCALHIHIFAHFIFRPTRRLFHSAKSLSAIF